MIWLPICAHFSRIATVEHRQCRAAGTPDGPTYAKLMRALPCDVIGFEPVVGECEKLND